MRFLIAAAFLATPAFADYLDHPTVEIFSNRPCTEAVGLIDSNLVSEDLRSVVAEASEKAMAWGFVLGFDTAEGGLKGADETTLVRLRKACAENPDKPALDLLRGFSE